MKLVLLCPGATTTNFSKISGYDAEMPSFVTQTPEQVVDTCLRGMKEGQKVITPGIHNKASRAMSRFVPTGLITRVGKAFFPAHSDVEQTRAKAQEVD